MEEEILKKESMKLSTGIMDLISEFIEKNKDHEITDIILSVDMAMACALCYIADSVIRKDASPLFKIRFIEEIAELAKQKYRNTDKMN